MTALEQYQRKKYLMVPRHAIVRAVLNLKKIEALVLIRASFCVEDNWPIALEDAKLIYSMILNEQRR